MQAVILAAGKGSRLHPITVERSKAMLPILGKPIVERVMEMLVDNGIRDFILVVSPEDRHITRHFRRESSLDADIRFVYQPERKGMANALSCAAPLISEDFVLSACDNLVAPRDVGRLISGMLSEPQPNGILTLMSVEPARIASGAVVETEGAWVRRIIEKPSPEEVRSDLASLPLYAFSNKLLEYLPEVRPSSRGEYELQDAIQMLIDRDGKVSSICVERRLTLTNAADLLALNCEYLIHGGDHPQLAPLTVGPGTHLITPLHIERGTVIGSNCTIGPNVYIERDCCVGKGVTVRDAVLLHGARLPDGATVIDEVVA
jgi:NDP-sugar pyrophosphorylase family protein